MKKNNFRLEITQANDNQMIFSTASVSLNLKLENTWEPLVENSLLAAENLLLKIEDWKNWKIYYLFLQNTNVFVEDKIIKINLLNEIQMYKSVKRRVTNPAQEKKLLELRNQIYILKLEQEVGINLEEMIKLKKLLNQVYLEKAIKIFNLVKMENFNEKKLY